MTRAAKIQQKEEIVDQLIDNAILATGMNASAAEWLRLRRYEIFSDDGKKISCERQITDNCMRLTTLAECGIADIDTPADFLFWFHENVEELAKDAQTIYGYDIPAQRLKYLIDRLFILVYMEGSMTEADAKRIAIATNSKPKHVKDLYMHIQSRDYCWIAGRVSSFARCETRTAQDRFTYNEDYYFVNNDGEHVVVEKEAEAEYVTLSTHEVAINIIEELKAHHPAAYQQLQDGIAADGICTDAAAICEIVFQVWDKVQKENAEIEAMAEAVVAVQELVEVAEMEEEVSVTKITAAAPTPPPRQRLSPLMAYPSQSRRSSLRSSTRSSHRKSPFPSARI